MLSLYLYNDLFMDAKIKLYHVEISGYSVDWDLYLKYYKIVYKQKDKFEESYIILRENSLKELVNIELPDNTEKLSVKIHIITPSDVNLSPLNMIINLYRGEVKIDIKKFSKNWNEDSLTIDLNYLL